MTRNPILPHAGGDARAVVRVVSLFACLATTGACAVAGTIELNPKTSTYDDHPSVSSAADGVTWMAWHTYRDGGDGVVARRLDRAGTLGPLHTISDKGRTHGPPSIVARSADRAWIVWSMRRAGHWRVMLRAWRDGRWGTPQQLSDPGFDAIFPTAVVDADDRLLVAWSARVGDQFRIRGRRLGNAGELQTIFEISTDGENFHLPINAYRPTLVQHDGHVWAFWDQYHRRNYVVQGRRVLPTAGKIEQVSPPGEYCLTPTADSHAGHMYVAWLRKIDVVGGPGVISQWHTLHAAMRAGDEWIQIRDADGKSEAAELTQGLMAQITPRPVATGGYLGSRVRPLLHACDDRLWLLWERKSDHRGSTPRVAGDLIGRPIGGQLWQAPRVVHRGHVDYHVIHAPIGEPTGLTVVASKLPRQAHRTYERIDIDVEAATPFEQAPWPGWSPLDLPIQAEQTPRRQVAVDGNVYQLYWADLHCHSNLSADAEGETDELNHYAQDRAGLDVVVFTNNDFYNVPLTQYEYEVGNLIAASHTVEGEFLSLPGYEWTSRIPGVTSARLDDAGNWLPPYQNRSYANHRSVIYPPAGGPLVHFTEVGNDIAALNEAVADAGGITLSQHPTFQLSGHAVEVGLELTSGWSNYIARNPRLFHGSLNKGRMAGGARLGFVANGDSHRRAPGLSGALTGIYAERLTPTGIIEALRQRRCFATAGARIFVDARAGGTFMGQEVDASNRRIALTLHAVGTRAITSAVLVRDGQQIYEATGDGQREFRAEFGDEALTPGVHWYYWRISQDVTAPVLPGNLMAAHGHLAWSSPMWVVVK